MTNISPRHLSHILRLSFFSRVIFLFIQIVSNRLVKDHNADAYRSGFHKSIVICSKDLPWPYEQLHWIIEGSTRWDSQYFLEISNHGYISEQHLAFLPIFPISIAALRRLLFGQDFQFPDISSNQFGSESCVEDIPGLVHYINSVLIGVILNNFIFFPLATISLYALTKKLFPGDEKYSRNIIWWFCFNPASIFFTVCYTESLFSALTFTSLFLIEYRSKLYLEQRGGPSSNDSIGNLNRLIYICVPSLVLLALSAATRSNGLISIGFIVYQFIQKYVSLIRVDRTGWSLTYYAFAISELIQDCLFALISALVIASGYVIFQIYSYNKFCLESRQPEKGKLIQRPSWCNNSIPHPYQHVQLKFWNVGPFNFYQPKQIPNFLLALPVTLISLIGSLNKSRKFSQLQTGKDQLPYYVQLVALVLFSGVNINIQVTTRLIASSCPAFYWICEDLSRVTRTRRKVMLFYFVSYSLVGTILHSNFYPWT